MRISLIGMSGCGKTYWSKKLMEKGYKRYCCDDLIEIKLQNELIKEGFSGGIQEVAKWLGFPYNKQYQKASSVYMKCEEEVMNEILSEIQTLQYRDVVIDTTGSVIYISASTLQKMKNLTKVIYLELSNEKREKQYEIYVSDPKPVIWGNIFKKGTAESNQQALVRCYPKLLYSRMKEYENHADITLGFHQLLEKHFT